MSAPPPPLPLLASLSYGTSPPALEGIALSALYLCPCPKPFDFWSEAQAFPKVSPLHLVYGGAGYMMIAILAEHRHSMPLSRHTVHTWLALCTLVIPHVTPPVCSSFALLLTMVGTLVGRRVGTVVGVLVGISVGDLVGLCHKRSGHIHPPQASATAVSGGEVTSIRDRQEQGEGRSTGRGLTMSSLTSVGVWVGACVGVAVGACAKSNTRSRQVDIRPGN